jgi:hypothetical protein
MKEQKNKLFSKWGNRVEKILAASSNGVENFPYHNKNLLPNRNMFNITIF